MIQDLKPYSQYKDSGLPWLGEIPSHWAVRRIKTLFREKEERSLDGKGTLLSLTRTRGLIPQSEASSRLPSADDLSKYKSCQPGDLVMNRMQAWSGMFAVASTEGLISPDYSVFITLDSIKADYFLALFKTPLFVDQFAQHSKGIGSGFNRLYTPDFGSISTLVPPPEEQAQIVRFLEHVNRRIRGYIRAKQKLIKLLKEQKQAIIRRAVTCGFDTNVDFRPCAIPWVKDIPAHWQVMPLKRVLRRLIDCEHKTAPAVEESEYRVVRTTAVRDGALLLPGTYCTTEPDFIQWTRRGVPEPGDVIFTREAPAGEACVVPVGQRLCLGQRTVLMKVRREVYDPRYLVHSIYVGPPSHQIAIASQGSTVGHFNVEDIAALLVFVPPLHEQHSIVNRIEECTGSLSLGASQAECEVNLLREYRTRLVTNVVTGKLNVREASQELPEGIEEIGAFEEPEELTEEKEEASEANVEAATEEAEA